MRHNIQCEGFGVRLRPVELADAEFIVWLRNLEHAKGRVGDSAATTAAQEVWLRTYFDRAGDYYFIIETLNRKPVGAYGLYDIRGPSAESGRWVIRPEVPAAVPSALVAFDIAFGILKLKELRVKTISSNQNVLSLNRKLGFQQTRIEQKAQVIGGKSVDQVHFLLKAVDWLPYRMKLELLAKIAERQVLEWEKQ
jgi:RimJ/RimL family protein N-acetyltransferase